MMNVGQGLSTESAFSSCWAAEGGGDFVKIIERERNWSIRTNYGPLFTLNPRVFVYKIIIEKLAIYFLI